jgi:hypothetical protein
MFLNQNTTLPSAMFSISNNLNQIEILSALQSQTLVNENINHHYTPESALPVIDWF